MDFWSEQLIVFDMTSSSPGREEQVYVYFTSGHLQKKTVGHLSFLRPVLPICEMQVITKLIS